MRKALKSEESMKAVISLIPPSVRRKVPRGIKDWVRSRWRSHPTPIYDIGEPLPRGHLKVTGQPRRALLSYITMPFRLSPDDPRGLQFSNLGIARSIVRALNELGYIVDIVEYTNTKFLPHRHYDLFVGHGGYNFERIAHNLWPDTVKIYFSTGCYWRFHNERELARFADLKRRRGVSLRPDRLITASEEWANGNTNGIICLGNEFVTATYSKFPIVLNLNNAAYPDDHYDIAIKDFAFARQNFLFFAGAGNVHKGLDRLLEVFPRVNAHLWICQDIRPDFYEVYEHELEDYPNIHLVRSVPMRSAQFYYLVDRCAFMIHLSCAEGQPGTVVECMHQGLIPIVSRESNIDTSDYGITLNTSSIEEITEVVQNLLQRPPEWCEEMSWRTRRIAVMEFSEAAFLENMRNAIQYIITPKKRMTNGECKTKMSKSIDFTKHGRQYGRNVLSGTTHPIITQCIRVMRQRFHDVSSFESYSFLKKEPTISENIKRFVESRNSANIPKRPHNFEKRVCIVVPCYKHARYLETTFKSIVSQTWRPFQVIFVNDCSPDNTQTILERFAQNSPQGVSCEILRLPRNVGQDQAINFAIKSTEAEVIMELDADDYLMHDALEVALGILRAHEDIFMIGATSFWFRKDRDLSHWPTHIKDIAGSREIEIKKWGPQDALKFKHPSNISMTHSSCTFFRCAWKVVGGYYPDVSKRVVRYNDRDFQMRVCSMFPIGVSLEVPFAFWREGSSANKKFI